MSNILIPTDFTEGAQNAASYALEVFGESAGRIILLNAFPETSPEESLLISVTDLLHEDSHQKLLAEHQRLSGRFQRAQNKLHQVALPTSMSEAIRRTIDHEKVDLIVLCSRLFHSIKHQSMPAGKHWHYPIPGVARPVLVVPEAG